MWYEHAHNHFSKQYFQMWCPLKIASIQIGSNCSLCPTSC
ncbi:hypothetical protein GBAR_LOCUS17834, partial [Geodia barretti]